MLGPGQLREEEAAGDVFDRRTGTEGDIAPVRLRTPGRAVALRQLPTSACMKLEQSEIRSSKVVELGCNIDSSSVRDICPAIMQGIKLTRTPQQ